jgi:hypothetical protein
MVSISFPEITVLSRDIFNVAATLGRKWAGMIFCPRFKIKLVLGSQVHETVA